MYDSLNRENSSCCGLHNKLTRRKFMGGLAVAGAGFIDGSSSQSDVSSVGVPPEYVNHGFEAELDELYEDFPGFDRDRRNVLYDVIPVGGNRMEEEVAEVPGILHEPLDDVNVVVGHRKESYPEDEFLVEYGGDVARIFGVKSGYQGFVESEISSEMQEAAVQVIMTPGKQEEPVGALEYSLAENTGESYRLGYAFDTQIAVASETAFESVYEDDYMEGRKRLFGHEVGHSPYRLGHSNNPGDLMHEDIRADSDLEFTPGELGIIGRKL